MTILLLGVILAIVIILCVLSFFKRRFSYWLTKRVPFIKPRIPFGTVENPFNRKHNSVVNTQQQYEHFKSLGIKYGGYYAFHKPWFLPVDPHITRDILVKDFQYFSDRGFFRNKEGDPLSVNLLNSDGHEWRYLRTKLTPTFSTGKIKAMFPTLVVCGDPLFLALTGLCGQNNSFDAKDVIGRYTTDVVGSCAFGLQCQSFDVVESDFRKYGRMAFGPFTRFTTLKILFADLFPTLVKRMRITIVNLDYKKFFLNVVRNAVEFRKDRRVTRNDFLQLLIAQMHENDGLTIEQVASQSFLFFLAGHETSATTMTFCVYELAINQDVQQKVRNEINSVLEKHGGIITYDAVMEMKYLDNVIDETLRKYPPFGSLFRKCVQEYKISETETVIDVGTPINIPVHALHHDPDHYPNPNTFDPDRFNEVNKKNIKPFTYLPFGEGPRVCIGLRFGYLLSKVGLITMLRNFRYTLSVQTKVPIQFDRDRFVLTADGGIWLNIEKV